MKKYFWLLACARKLDAKESNTGYGMQFLPWKGIDVLGVEKETGGANSLILSAPQSRTRPGRCGFILST
jgi:hypothetical protein